MKKKIWFVNQYAIAPNLAGGTRHFDFASSLNKSGNETTIFCSSFHNISRRETIKYSPGQRKRKSRYENVDYIWIKTREYKTNGLARLLNMIDFSKNLFYVGRNMPKPDIIIGSSPNLFAALAAYFLSKKHRVPFVIEVRDLWPLTLIDAGQSKYNPLIIIFAILEKFLYRKSAAIIALMPKASEYITKLGISKKKIYWISNGVNLASFSEKAKVRKDKFFLITYAGTVGEFNNIELVVEAARIVQQYSKKIKIEIIGDGVKRCAVSNLIDKYSLSNIEIKPPIAKNKIVPILKSSDALLFTLKKASVFRYGNPPNKLFDYFACRKPIIFSSNASNNLVRQAAAGISVPPDNAKKLAQAILDISHASLKSRCKMGDNGFRFVKTNYSIRSLSSNLDKVLNAIINEKNSIH